MTPVYKKEDETLKSNYRLLSVLSTIPKVFEQLTFDQLYRHFSLLFSDKKKFSFTLQPTCIEVGRVRVDEARDRLKTKKKQYDMIFSSVIYIMMALTALF